MNTESTLVLTAVETHAVEAHAPQAHDAEAAVDNVVALDGHQRYRSRDVGVGYGRSSGYGMDRRYTSDWGAARFRCA